MPGNSHTRQPGGVGAASAPFQAIRWRGSRLCSFPAGQFFSRPGSHARQSLFFQQAGLPCPATPIHGNPAAWEPPLLLFRRSGGVGAASAEPGSRLCL